MATQSNRPMVSETSICNQALSWLGATKITSMDERSKEAEHCLANYDQLRDAVLEERMWTFATDRDTSTTSDQDAWGQMYKHAVPLDWVSVFRVFRNVSDPNNRLKSEGWVREGRYILAEESTVYLWGIKRITDTGHFSPLFVQALAHRLAAELSVPLVGDTKKAAYHWNLYKAMLADAAARDGQQGSNERIRSSSLVDARGG